MNDDSILPEPAASAHDAGEGSSRTRGLEAVDSARDVIIDDGETRRKRARERVLEQARKTSELLVDILVNLDIIIWANFAAMYYVDNSTLRFLLRLITQYTYLTPKPPPIPSLPAIHALLPILCSNLFCILMHSLTSLPRSSETNRGYLHGSLIVDFIGQLGFTWKSGLVAFDLVIVALMTFCFVVKVEGDKVKEMIKTFKSGAGPSLVADAVTAGLPGQDLDAEEQGVVRGVVDENGDVELQDLHRAESDTQEGDRLLDGGPEADPSEGGVLDVFYSGNVVVADFHVMHTLRGMRNTSHVETGATALQGVSYSTAYGWARIQQRLGRLR